MITYSLNAYDSVKYPFYEDSFLCQVPLLWR